MKSKVCVRCRRVFSAKDCAVPGNFHKAKYCGWDCYQAGKKFTPAQALAAFWEKVAKRGPDECWHWTGAKRWDGYGRLHWLGKQTTANRVSYELAHGPIAPGLTILHSCDQPSCCNPAHLRADTHLENVRDMHRKGRAATKLNAELVRTIRTRATGKNDHELAAEFGVVNKTIWEIRTGRKWRHVQ